MCRGANVPDFDAMVRERLGDLKLSRDEQEEVYAEISGHLELHFAAEVESGAVEPVALRDADRQVGDWDSFRKSIQITKGDFMSKRLHRIWIPGLVVGVIFLLAQNALIHLREPQIIPFYGAVLNFDWARIPMAIIAGACIACWSRAMGGTVANRIAATLVPTAAFAALMLLMAPIAISVDRHISVALQLWIIFSFLLWMAILPAATMFLGALPFLRGSATSAPEPPQAPTHA
jgi:hypothetical protein